MRVMVSLGVLCLAFQYVCAQRAGDSGLSITLPESTTADVEIETANFEALPSSSRDIVTLSSSPTSTPEKAAADDVSSSRPSSSFASTSVQQSSGRPKATAKGPHPQSGVGHTSATKHTIRPSRIPSLPSPETPPNHPNPPPFPSPSKHIDTNQSRGLSATAIAFAVLGGVFGILLMLMGVRCCYSWRRAPGRDRIHDVVSRHLLDREMEEREREEIQRRWSIFRSSAVSPTRLVPPPPPYVNAPSYEETVTSGAVPVAAERV
ncbi:hypothetical protein BC835DRAFT_1411913 [Cytidiella melzeri]|nr:hypothetical protein BC835DRAFT_1411913 [Cytidiella melzeri]